MKNFEKKLLSTICAISLAMSPVGSLGVMAEEETENNSVVNQQQTQSAVEELKGLISALAEDVTFDNVANYEDEVNSIWEKYSALTDEEKAELNVPIDASDLASDTYKKKIENAKGVVDASPVAEYIRDELPTIGGDFPNIKSNDYIDYYEQIEEAGILYDGLSRAAQNRLGDTPYRYKYQKVLEDFIFYWDADVETVVELIGMIETDAANINVDNYADKFLKVQQAEEAYVLLHDEQKEDVSEIIGKDGEDAIQEGKDALDSFKVTSWEEIEKLIDYDAVTFENYQEVKANAEKAQSDYDKFLVVAPEYEAQDAETKMADLIKVAEFYAEADKIDVAVKEDLTSANYYPDKDALIDAAVALKSAFTAAQAGYATEGIEYVNNALDLYEAYKEELIQTAEDKINAIPTFTAEDWGTDKWTEVENAIGVAAAAIGLVHEDHKSEIENLDEYNEKVELFEKIKADYAAVQEFIDKVNSLGEVGDVATDNITLTSRSAIDEALNLYAPLTDDQKALAVVVNKKTTLDNANDNCTALENQKAVIENLIAEFDEFIVSFEVELDYGSTTADADIDASKEVVVARYDAAYAAANDETYGTKLSTFVNQTHLDKKDKVLAFADAFKNFRTASEGLEGKSVELYELLASLMDALPVDAEESDLTLADIEIDAETSRDDIQAILEAVMKYHADSLEDVNDAIVDTDKTAYVSTKNALALYNADENEYCATFDAYVAQNEVINEVMNEINPMEAVAEVDTWAEEVNELFNVIEESCVNDLEATKVAYQELCDARDEFRDDAVVWQYTVRYQSIALSNLEYINDRIYQYERGTGYVEKVTVAAERLDKIDELRANDGETAYRQELEAVKQEFVDSCTIYDALEVAVTEVPNVQNARKVYEEAIIECEDRVVAYDNFDSKASALINAEELPKQEKVTEVWDEYVALTDAQKALTTKVDDLAAKEKEIVEKAISALDGKTIDGGLIDAVAEAEVYVDQFGENQVKYDGDAEISNVADLEEYIVVLDLYDVAKEIYDEITDENWYNYVDAIELAEAEIAGFNPANENVIGIKAKVAGMIGEIKAIVVTGMLVELPDPDAIEAMTDLAELEETKAALDAVKAEYDALHIINKLQVREYGRYELGLEAYEKALADYNQREADAIEELIDAIGYIDANGNVTMTKDNFEGYIDAIEEAEEAVENASDAIKTLVENVPVLTSARADYDSWKAAKEEAQVVIDLIEGLAVPADITNENYAEIREDWTAADEALADLSGRAYEFITDEMGIKLDDVDIRLSFVEAYMEVVVAIDEQLLGEEEVYENIVNNGAIDVEYALIIANLENQYNELERGQKLEVYNYAVLYEARNTYDRNVQNAIDTVKANIDGLDLDTLVHSQENADLIGETREIINSLSDENKELIGQDRIEKFEAIEARYAEAMLPDEVEALIEEIGTDELTEENLDEKKAAVEIARDAYETMLTKEQILVENYAALVVWEEAIANFRVDHSGDINLDGSVDINDINSMVKMALKKYAPTEEEFELANLVKEIDETAEEVIDIFDVLAAIEKIVF